MDDATAFIMTHESDPDRQRKGLSVQALTLTRSLGRRGIDVVRVHPNHLDSGLLSRYCSAVEICPDLYTSEKQLVEYLQGLAERYAGKRVLIPASDDCAHFVARYEEQLRPHYALPSPSQQVMETIIDKKRQLQAAERLGVPIPETYFPETQAEVEELAPRLENFPYVIKPLVAHKWRLAAMESVSKHRKGIRVDNPEELIREYRGLGAARDEVMLQEVIQGRDQRLFTFLTYFDRDSQPLAYCIRSKIRQKPIDFGYCTLTISCYNDEVERQSIALLKGIGYRGIAGVEWKHDPRTGEYKLIEINARAVNTIGIAAACGVDIPHIAFMDALGEPVTPVHEWEEGVKWVRMSADVWAARELYRRGSITLGDWWRSWRGRKVHAVFAADDLLPIGSRLAIMAQGQFIGRIGRYAARRRLGQASSS